MNLRDYLIDPNAEPTGLAVHYGLLADIYKQTKDLPDGTPLKAVVTDCDRGAGSLILQVMQTIAARRKLR